MSGRVSASTGSLWLVLGTLCALIGVTRGDDPPPAAEPERPISEPERPFSASERTVQQYGAVGDGVADDTRAIQRPWQPDRERCASGRVSIVLPGRSKLT